MICDIRFIFIFSCLFYASEALRWTKYLGNTVTTETVISMMNAKSSPEIDVSSGVQITIIRNTKNFERRVSIYCLISGYNDQLPIEYSFCKETECFIAKDGTNLVVKQFNFMLTIETNVTNQKGLKVGLQLLGPTNDFSGNYFCKANNNNFAIRSNIIEIRDTIFWGLNLFSKIISTEKTDTKMITLNTLPHVLNCSIGGSELSLSAPKWTKIEFFSPVFWSVCPVLKSDQAQAEKNKMTLAKCLQFSKDKCEDSINAEICPQPVNKMPDWTTYVNQGGDLIFTELRPQTSSNIDSYSFMCYTKDKTDTLVSLFYFYDIITDTAITKGITFDAVNVATKPLRMISPQIQTFIIYARQIPKDVDVTSVKPVAIYALFESSPTATVTWKLGDTKLNSNQMMKVSKYTVTFPGDVTSEQAGTYTLEVSDKTERITMTINVQVLGPPILTFSACMIPLLYLWDGGSASFSCAYKQRPTDMKLQINSQEIKLSDPLENSKANLKSSNPYLEMLSFSMSPTNFVVSDSVTITYEVYNLTKSQGQTQYQDHSVTFIASNDFGISVKSSSIYVLPRLISIVTKFPEKYNCTSPCRSDSTHIFQCEVRVEDYANKELKIDHYWTINSYRLGEANIISGNIYAAYFKVDPKTKELTMLPIKSNDTATDKMVKDALKSNTIECNVNLSPLNSGDSDFMYVSSTDKSLGNSMKARITLDYEPISTAYVYWIVAVILGLIVLVIIIVLLTRYCMKNKGDVYQLDKLEREHGYDPEKEVREEMFKPYERQDHEATAPDDTDGRKLSITGHSIGSNDDGDLDNYELDPSNFNEDGSLVGKYGANPRNRAAMA